MNFLACLEAKRDGQALPPSAWRELVQAHAQNRIPDYQMSAFLMAVLFQGCQNEEVHALTLAMRDSGNVLAWPADPRPVVDKHSTGGVGDKVSLPLAPLLAALEFRVPMISGRGLGITGGTLDKLASIPGFSTKLTPVQIVEQVQSLGVAMAEASADIVPADQKLYALRDVTGTVPSQPLITASILSKKLAEGLDALVLDVKFGRAAFMRKQPAARQLAQAMVSLGQSCGLKTCALLTAMDTPLGRAAGNWLEVLEAVACLRHQGPPDLQRLVVECAAQLLILTGRAGQLENARQLASDALTSGKAYEKFCLMTQAQGGDPSSWEAPENRLPQSPVIQQFTAKESGYVAECDAKIMGEIIRDLGGGRQQREDKIHPLVGLDAIAKPGEAVSAGATLCRVHAANSDQAQLALERLPAAFSITPEPPPDSCLIHDIVT